MSYKIEILNEESDFAVQSFTKYFDKFIKTDKFYKGQVSVVKFVLSKEQNDGYEINYDCKILTFTGNKQTLIYAVYDFLSLTGWRFYTPIEDVLTKKCTFNFDKSFKLNKKIDFAYRSSLWHTTGDIPWIVKNKLNYIYGTKIPEEFGGGIEYAGKMVHTFGTLIPAKQYFSTNPEFFSMGEDGVRNTNQLCLTNEKLLEEVIKNVKTLLRENPTANVVSVSQNDNFGECRCPKCKEYLKDKNSSDLMLDFVNKVAVEIKKEFPNVFIETLAYEYTVDPPKKVVPKDNVSIMFCFMHSCHNHRLDGQNCKQNTRFMDIINGWKNYTKNIRVWNYYSNFSYYISPFQILRDQNKNFGYLLKSGVGGLFLEGSHCGQATDFCELKAYAFAKLLWEPNMSDGQYDELIKEFLEYFYGKPSATYLYKYLKLLDKMTGKTHYDCYPAPYTVMGVMYGNAPYDAKTFVNKADYLFKKALEFAKTKKYYERIEKEYIALEYFYFYVCFEKDMFKATDKQREKLLYKQKMFYKKLDKYKIKNLRSISSGIEIKK